MLNLMSVKAKQQDEKKQGASVGKPAELRLQKDMSDLNLPSNTTMHFPEGKDKIFHFEITMIPDQGYHRNGRFLFTFNISHNYPYEAPKVKCKTKVFHPNIDLEGNICLNILREDWKPVLSVSTIVYGLQFLLLDPNPEDPLNKDAAEMLINNEKQFEAQVQRSIQYGCHINGEYFPPCR